MSNKKENTFEDNIKEFEIIVKKLESGDVSLDDALNEYIKAIKLSKLCTDKIKSVEEQINKILLDNGTIEDFVINE